MCNHYQTDRRAEWASMDRLRGAIPVAMPVTIPFAIPELPDHVFPKRPARVVRQQGGLRSLVAMQWGITRFIGQGKSKPVTNARNDKLLSRTWQANTERRRCLIPATGYYEPGLGPVGAKGEILFRVLDRPVFFIAGLWQPEDAGATFTMVTTAPNEAAARFHDRMPLVLDDADLEEWLGDEPLPEHRLHTLCRGLAASHLLIDEQPAPLKITRPQRPDRPQPPRPNDGQATLF